METRRLIERIVGILNRSSQNVAQSPINSLRGTRGINENASSPAENRSAILQLKNGNTSGVHYIAAELLKADQS